MGTYCNFGNFQCFRKFRALPICWLRLFGASQRSILQKDAENFPAQEFLRVLETFWYQWIMPYQVKTISCAFFVSRGFKKVLEGLFLWF